LNLEEKLIFIISHLFQFQQFHGHDSPDTTNLDASQWLAAKRWATPWLAKQR
jgi:hypothetical protein